MDLIYIVVYKCLHKPNQTEISAGFTKALEIDFSLFSDSFIHLHTPQDYMAHYNKRHTISHIIRHLVLAAIKCYTALKYALVLFIHI